MTWGKEKVDVLSVDQSHPFASIPPVCQSILVIQATESYQAVESDLEGPIKPPCHHKVSVCWARFDKPGAQSINWQCTQKRDRAKKLQNRYGGNPTFQTPSHPQGGEN